MIGLVDCKTCNLQSLINALEHQKIDFRLIKSSNDFSSEYKTLLPGVGSFKTVMENLYELNMIDKLKKSIDDGNYFMGICVGMQILLEKGYEDKITEGLKIFKGNVKKIKAKNTKIPIIGWNAIMENDKIDQDGKNILHNLNNKKFYFLHSFFCDLNFTDTIAYTQTSNFKYPAVIKKKNTYGVQFHPEKSREQGLQLIKNFSKI